MRVSHEEMEDLAYPLNAVRPGSVWCDFYWVDRRRRARMRRRAARQKRAFDVLRYRDRLATIEAIRARRGCGFWQAVEELLGPEPLPPALSGALGALVLLDEHG